MEVFILMGIKHCGKSTQGRLLSKNLNCLFYDTDDIIFELNKKTPRQIFSSCGEELFKNAEYEACAFLAKKIRAENKTAVIATGGGICNNGRALNELHQLGKFIFLKTEESIACERIIREAKIQTDGSLVNLPAYIAKKEPKDLQQVKNIFHDFFEERVKIYSSIADITIKMGKDSKEENLGKILEVI